MFTNRDRAPQLHDAIRIHARRHTRLEEVKGLIDLVGIYLAEYASTAGKIKRHHVGAQFRGTLRREGREVVVHADATNGVSKFVGQGDGAHTVTLCPVSL